MPTRQQKRLLFAGAIDLVRGGLVSEYRFGENGGTTITDFVSGFHGTLGAGGQAPTWTSQGLAFSAAGSQFATASVSGLNTGWTACVFGSVTAAGASRRTFFGFKPTGAGTQFVLQQNTTGAVRIFDNVNTAGAIATSIPTNTPIMLAHAVPLSSTARPYLGLTALTTYATGASVYDLAQLNFGRSPAPGEYFDGNLYYLLLYNRALTLAEITQNYAAVKVRLAARGVTLT